MLPRTRSRASYTGTVPIGTGLALRMARRNPGRSAMPVERSITVSAPNRSARRSFPISASKPEESADVPMLALTLTENRLPITMGSASGWLTLHGMTARPAATSSHTSSGGKAIRLRPRAYPKDSRIAAYSMWAVTSPALARSRMVLLTRRASPAETYGAKGSLTCGRLAASERPCCVGRRSFSPFSSRSSRNGT